MSSFPGTTQLATWISRALGRQDARSLRRTEKPVVISIEADVDADMLGSIEYLVHEEITLIREVLDVRFAGDHVSPELAASLREIHRRGWAVRQCCNDRALDIELGWLQGFGTFALLADLSELDRAVFEHDLDHRVVELQRALILRRAYRSNALLPVSDIPIGMNEARPDLD